VGARNERRLRNIRHTSDTDGVATRHLTRLKTFAQTISTLKADLSGGYLVVVNAAMAAERQMISHSEKVNAAPAKSSSDSDEKPTQNVE
jgi:hypothetical protein